MRAMMQRIAAAAAVACVTCAAMLIGCGSSRVRSANSVTTVSHLPGPPAIASSTQVASEHGRDGDWTRFNYDAVRSGVGPTATGITAQNAGTLQTRVVRIDGTADSSPIELHDVRVAGSARDAIVVTTSYGHTIAIDPASGSILWEFRPPGTARLEGTSRVTTASPVADPERRHIYVASPDGFIHKLELASGREVRQDHWPARVTRNAKTEKIGGALNLSGNQLLAVIGGYEENTPNAQSYQGHVVSIDHGSGRILQVFNALCSDHRALLVPRSCHANDAGIWARSGVVVEPGSGRLLVATGNGHFNGSTRWGDSVLELSPDASRVLHNWTPGNQAQLDRTDFDIGSTAPAVLPVTQGRHLAVQGGKDGVLRLLDLDRLNGSSGGAGPRTSGELQAISTLGGGLMFTAPAVWTQSGHIYVFVGDEDGIAGYTLVEGRVPQLAQIWSSPTKSTSPIIAGGLLYAFDLPNRTLDIRVPTTGKLIRSLPAAIGHWNSPIAIGGRVVLPVGDYQKHLTEGVIYIYHLPGR